MKILGITGGSGCGKTTLLLAAKELGAYTVDCDALYHELLKNDSALLRAIEAEFPAAFQNGILQRRVLGELVFGDPNGLRRLNAITHPRVVAEVRRRLDGRNELFAAIDAVGLFESGLAELCDATVAVTAPEEARISRLMRREGIPRDYALSRLRAQKSDAEFSAAAAYTLENRRETRQEFFDDCKQFLKGVIHMANYEELRKELLFAPKNGYDRISEADLAAMEPYCKEYMDFISTCKIEREAVDWTIAEAEKAGFRAYRPGMELKPGDRVYGNNCGKSVIFAVIGSERHAHLRRPHRLPASGPQAESSL